MKTESLISGEIIDGTEVVYKEAEDPAINLGKESELQDPTEKTLVIEDTTSHHSDNELPFAISDLKLKEEEEIAEAKRRPCYRHPRFTELYLKADWWTLWIGLLSFGLAVALVFAVPLESAEERILYVVPQPKSWQTNPFDAWDWYNVVGIPLLLLMLLALYLGSLKAMGKLGGYVSAYVGGFIVMTSLATVAFWLGRNEWCSEHGLGYAIFAILLGMIVSNVPVMVGNTESLDWLQKRAAKDGEFFIKCSLALLAVELTVLAELGGPAMLVSWIGSPVAIVAGFVIGTRLLGCKDSLAMLIAVGASWCGASAISAVAPVILASSEDVALAISVVAFFTIPCTFAQPYIAMAVGMPDDVAGAWIGGSVDQTGNVIVSAAIISEEATEVAGIVKMVLNAGMGCMASVVACYWSACRLSPDENDNGTQPKLGLVMLWDKFPKFTLGFIITSAILTGMVQTLEGTLEAEALPRAVSTLNKWWFAIAFVGIGLTTNVKKLFQEAWKSGVIQVYLVANTIDIFLALGLAYFSYSTVA